METYKFIEHIQHATGLLLYSALFTVWSHTDIRGNHRKAKQAQTSLALCLEFEIVQNPPIYYVQ